MNQLWKYWILASGTFLVAGSTVAQVTTTTQVEDGVTFQVTRTVVERQIPVTEYQTREEKYLRPQVSTQYQTLQQTHLTPVTQYQMVPRMVNRWNPFVEPSWRYEYVPVTRWEARPTTVQVPLAKTDWVEEKRTVQVPVTTYKTVKEEQMRKVALGVVPGATPSRTIAGNQPAATVASQPTNESWKPIGGYGGQQLPTDPPSKPRYESLSPKTERY